MVTIEVERERIEELQLAVVLEEMLLLNPLARLRVLGELGLEPRLARELALQHALGEVAVGCRNSVDGAPCRRYRSVRCKGPSCACWKSGRRRDGASHGSRAR